MPATKSVVVGMSVAGGVAVLTLLAVLLYVFVPRKAASSGGGVPTKCKGAPTVNASTGAVSNFDQVVMPDGATCGENVAFLNKLCLNTVCTHPDLCKAADTYETWDAYDSDGHKCVKVSTPTCEQQVCDAPYCRSPSVRPPTLPPLHKRTSAVTKACINPSEAEVAGMCNQLPNHQYVTPDCRLVEIEKVIDMKPLPGVQNTTMLIQGQIVVPHSGETEAVQFSYTLAGAGGTFTGALTTSAPTDMSACGDTTTSMCLTYNIDLLPGAVRAGKYTLKVFGRPAWSEVNTMESVQPVSLTLVAPPVDPNVNAALNVKLSRQLASDLIADGLTLRQLLSPLPSQNPGLAMTIPPTLTVNALKTVVASDSTGAGTANAFYLAACDPSMCPLSGASAKLMSRALVFVAWPAVQPLPATQCKASTVQYEVRKDSAKNGASMLTPALATAFADLVQVGDHVKYTITTTQGTCKSQPVVLSIFVPPFSDELCHSIPIQGGVLPPWMWSTNAGCVWYPDDGGAQDYYCAFEYMNPTHSLVDSNGKVKLMLADQNNECKQVMPSYPQVTKPFAAPACNFADHVKDVCFTGYADPALRMATCSPALPLGTDGSESISNDGAFYDRLNRLNTFYGLHDTFKNPSIEKIQADNQVALYNSYYHCGVESDSERWGVTKQACIENDQACLSAVTNAACDTQDRNICLPWTPLDATGNKYTQQRVCFGDEAFTSSSCCKAGQVYMFDPSVPKSATGASRGSCQG